MRNVRSLKFKYLIITPVDLLLCRLSLIESTSYITKHYSAHMDLAEATSISLMKSTFYISFFNKLIKFENLFK